jgi:hypothetical protein
VAARGVARTVRQMAAHLQDRRERTVSTRTQLVPLGHDHIVAKSGAQMFDNNGSFLLALLEFFIFFAWFMCLFWIFGDLFRSRDLGGLAKTLWVLFIIVVPLLGMLVYLIARGHSMNQRTTQERQEVQAAQAEYIKSGAGSGPSPAEQIASAKQLLDTHIISQQEFDVMKAKALAT